MKFQYCPACGGTISRNACNSCSAEYIIEAKSTLDQRVQNLKNEISKHKSCIQSLEAGIQGIQDFCDHSFQYSRSREHSEYTEFSGPHRVVKSIYKCTKCDKEISR